MTVLQSPIGLRSILTSLVAFFIVVSSVSLLFERGQEAQVQLAVEHKNQEMEVKVTAKPHDQQLRDEEAQVQKEVKVSAKQYDQQLKGKEDQSHIAVKQRNQEMEAKRWLVTNMAGRMSSTNTGDGSLTDAAFPGICDTMSVFYHVDRFNATNLLEKLRNKRMVFVGDSVNRNQWVSLVCMVEASIPDDKLKMLIYNGSLYSFKAMEYNATIDFYWSPLLLESNSDNPIIHRVEYRIIRADRIEKHASVWRDADIIVFNSYLWWRKQRDDMKMKVMYGSFEDGDARLDEVEMIEGFEIALKKLTEWLGENINKNKTRIFFAGSSPTHSWASNWGGEDSNKCLNETEPIYKSGYKAATTDYSLMDMAKSNFRTLEAKGIHVQILNITELSDYRKDGHPTVFRKQYAPLTKEQIVNPASYADCTHWCLPGVPDVWNEFLYGYLMHK
ncbi:hypothetical protein EJB05_30095, partial [Eragrostis curvula]